MSDRNVAVWGAMAATASVAVGVAAIVLALILYRHQSRHEEVVEQKVEEAEKHRRRAHLIFYMPVRLPTENGFEISGQLLNKGPGSANTIRVRLKLGDASSTVLATMPLLPPHEAMNFRLPLRDSIDIPYLGPFTLSATWNDHEANEKSRDFRGDVFQLGLGWNEMPE